MIGTMMYCDDYDYDDNCVIVTMMMGLTGLMKQDIWGRSTGRSHIKAYLTHTCWLFDMHYAICIQCILYIMQYQKYT